MSNEFIDDPGLLQDFIAESTELLQNLDEVLVAMETSPEQAELVNRAFRALHTVKGTSGFLGFTHLVEVAHDAEEVLNCLRKGTLPVSRPVVDVLLVAVDQVRTMVRDIAAGARVDYDTSALREKLKSALSGPPVQAPVKALLGQVMMEEGAITAAELAESLSESASSGKMLGEVLVERQLASPEQVKEAVATQAGEPGEMAARALRVDVEKLDRLVNLVGELVLERNRLVRLSRKDGEHRSQNNEFSDALSQVAARVSFLTEELQSATLKTRMVPVETLFRRFPRMVRDVARALGKDVELQLEGQQTEVDKAVVEQISDPLVHLVRNALDHGIELPTAREKQGKARKGTLRLCARQEGDHIVIDVIDDGAGMDPDRIAAKAIEKGQVTADEVKNMTRRQVFDLIFLPGLSTAEKITDVSGRGVGMDVVRSNLKKLNGFVEMESEKGRGSRFTLKLPLTLAILPVLMVEAGGEVYGVPLRSVVETLRITPADIHCVNGLEALRLRDKVIAVQRLDRLFACPESDKSAEQLKVVVLAVADRRIGIVVDQLLGQEQTVIKPLGTILHHVPGVSGASISGDGSIRLVIDPAALVTMKDTAA